MAGAKTAHIPGANRPVPTTPPPMPTAGEVESERAFLEEQAKQAKTAVAAAAKDLKAHLSAAVGPKGLVTEHPWAAMGGAAVAGFATAYVAVPNKAQKVARRLATIERILDLERAAVKRDIGRAKSRPLSSRLLRLGLRLAKPAIISAISGAATGAAAGKTTGEEAGEQAGAEAGEDAGETAGRYAGAEAGEDAGEPAARF